MQTCQKGRNILTLFSMILWSETSDSNLHNGVSHKRVFFKYKNSYMEHNRMERDKCLPMFSKSIFNFTLNGLIV